VAEPRRYQRTQYERQSNQRIVPGPRGSCWRPSRHGGRQQLSAVWSSDGSSAEWSSAMGQCNVHSIKSVLPRILDWIGLACLYQGFLHRLPLHSVDLDNSANCQGQASQNALATRLTFMPASLPICGPHGKSIGGCRRALSDKYTTCGGGTLLPATAALALLAVVAAHSLISAASGSRAAAAAAAAARYAISRSSGGRARARARRRRGAAARRAARRRRGAGGGARGARRSESVHAHRRS
jgi:hypothetical protein